MNTTFILFHTFRHTCVVTPGLLLGDDWGFTVFRDELLLKWIYVRVAILIIHRYVVVERRRNHSLQNK